MGKAEGDCIVSIQDKIGNEIQGFGGHLRCTTCGRKEELGNVGIKLAEGWPRCCGYTMRWFTQRELDADMDQWAS